MQDSDYLFADAWFRPRQSIVERIRIDGINIILLSPVYEFIGKFMPHMTFGKVQIAVRYAWETLLESFEDKLEGFFYRRVAHRLVMSILSGDVTVEVSKVDSLMGCLKILSNMFSSWIFLDAEERKQDSLRSKVCIYTLSRRPDSRETNGLHHSKSGRSKRVRHLTVAKGGDVPLKSMN